MTNSKTSFRHRYVKPHPQKLEIIFLPRLSNYISCEKYPKK
jgi:hypothetical protein